MDLQKLGFARHEMFPCEVSKSGVLIPGRLNGADTLFVLSLVQADPIWLDLAYSEAHGLLSEHRDRCHGSIVGSPPFDAGVVPVASVEVLGASTVDFCIKAVDVVLSRPALQGRIAGVVGMGLFHDGILALDPAAQVCGFTRRSLSEGLATADHRLPLLKSGQGYTACTRAIEDGNRILDETSSPILLLDTSIVGSRLTLDYVRHEYRRSPVFRWLVNKAYKKRKPILWTFVMPGGESVRIPVGFLSAMTSSAAAGWGQSRIDGILGMNFLGQWTCFLIDLRVGELALFSR